MTFEIDNGTILRGSSSFADYPLVNNVVAALLYGINNVREEFKSSKNIEIYLS